MLDTFSGGFSSSRRANSHKKIEKRNCDGIWFIGIWHAWKRYCILGRADGCTQLDFENC